jgi:predicted RNA-binding protein YlqC (UPF0109 family)
MKDLILLIAQRLVTQPDAVEVTETEGDARVSMCLPSAHTTMSSLA